MIEIPIDLKEEGMMRKTAIFLLVLALCALMMSAIPMNACAAKITNITPSKGKVDHTAVVHGSNLVGTVIVVKFGDVQAMNVRQNSGNVIRCTIPEKDPTSPDIVFVSVWIDGIPVPGEPLFEYKTGK